MGIFSDGHGWRIYGFLLFTILATIVNGADIFLEWHVDLNNNIRPVSSDQPVITINGMFPGPLINASTNDGVHVNVFNHMDEPLLITWNGIQQRLNSWQDGVLGTNCPIQPGKNWTYLFQMKDQIGSFIYFPSTNFQKAGGGFGPIRVNNRVVIAVPFAKPEAEFDLLIGDWHNRSFKEVRSILKDATYDFPQWMLMNGKGPYGNPLSKAHESFTVSKGKTYRFRVSNVGTTWSFNFKIQNHTMELVETEGSYTKKITLDSLDVHVGQSYSVLVKADQDSSVDYYIVATPKLTNNLIINNTATLVGIGVLHYDSSVNPPAGPLPTFAPDPFSLDFSLSQAKSIRWNLTAGAARPNPQGTFNVSNVALSNTFILDGSEARINGVGTARFTVNNVSYVSPETPLKLADHLLVNFSSVFPLDAFSVNSSLDNAVNGTFVSSGIHKGWHEFIFLNKHSTINSWHLDGFGFYVVGFGEGEWNSTLRSSYNLHDPIVRSTIQVYPQSWTAVYSFLDNPGIWNLRSQILKNWYLGQEIYIRVHNPDKNPAKERPPPDNLLYCGLVSAPPPPAAAAPSVPPSPSSAPLLPPTVSQSPSPISIRPAAPVPSQKSSSPTLPPSPVPTHDLPTPVSAPPLNQKSGALTLQVGIGWFIFALGVVVTY